MLELIRAFCNHLDRSQTDLKQIVNCLKIAIYRVIIESYFIFIQQIILV
jgi:hypothetical protein